MGSICHPQMKSSKGTKIAEEPVSVRRIDDGDEEKDTIRKEADERVIEQEEINTEDEDEDGRTPKAAAISAAAVLPASITDDFGGGLGFGNDGSSMGAFFRRRRR